jgi:3,4-dihydroxy 2-butanone 4-phosphate synthase/GTP cyclohydrolase II
MEETIQLSSMKEAILSFKKGGIIIVMDDENRENEGDLIMAAEFATKEKVAFFFKIYNWYIMCFFN